MAEVIEQDGVSNCPIFNELDNKLANSEINEVVHIELPNLEHTEQLEDVTQEDREVSTSSGIVTRVKQEMPLPLGTDLLTAFQHGLEQTVALVQHMSREEQNQAWHTLQGLVVDKSLLPAEDSAVSTDKSLEYCQDAASSTNPTESSTNLTESSTNPTESSTNPTESSTNPTESSTNPTESSTNPTESSTNPTESSTNPTESSTNPTESSTNPTESSTNPTESSTNPTESSPSEECAEKDMVRSTNVTRTVTHRPVTRSTTQAPIVKQEKSDDMSTVKPKRKRGRPRKTPLENAPASVPHPGDVTSNMMSTRGRRKRQLSKHNENENNKIVEPTSNNDDPNDKEDREDEGNEGKEELRIKEENMIHLGGDDVERKMIYAAVEKTSGGWLCTVCGKLSSAKHNLLVHLRIHTGERPYSCKLCLKKFSVVSNLQRHTKDVHSGYQPFLCNRCDASFHNKRALNKHTRSQHADSVGKMYQCAECGKAFKVLAVLEAHMVLHSGDQPFVCSQCSRSFTFRTNLLRHMKIHTGDRPHKCKECGKGFIEKKSLVLHVDRQHLGIKPSDQGHCFTCSTCSKTFSNRANLHTHNFVHTGLKPHACPVCGKTFSLSSNMRRHLLTHSGEKPWECTDCHKCFTEKRSLEVHRRLHTGERPYACEICGKTFMQPGTLQSHMPVHSKTRAFTCDKCGKSFLRKSHMNFHMKKHKVAPPFACVFCDKRFYRKSDIDRHLLKHTNEKPYACQLCPKRFSRLQYLKEHGNMHTGARPYKCQQCDMAFADMSSCYKHRRTHTWQATGYADKPDATPTSTRSSLTNHVNIAPKQSSMSVSTVDLQNLKAVENIISLANVQMIFSSGKEQIVDGACITPATSTEISDLDNIVYETLLPNDQLKVLTNETMPCKDSPDNAAVFKDLSPEQATQLRLALARGMSLEVSDPSSAFTVSDSDLETVFIQEGCDKSTEASVTMSQGQFTDTIPCSKVVSADNTETVAEATTDDVAMEKLTDSVSMETAGDIIGKLYPEPMCGANETVGSTTAGPTGVTNLVESVSVDNGVTLSPVQLVGSASTQQYYLVLSGRGQEAMPVE